MNETETREIVTLHERIIEIDRLLGQLTTEKFLSGVRHAILLRQWSKENMPAEPIRQMSQTSEMTHGPYVTGFENRPHAGTGFEGKP